MIKSRDQSHTLPVAQAGASCWSCDIQGAENMCFLCSREPIQFNAFLNFRLSLFNTKSMQKSLH